MHTSGSAVDVGVLGAAVAGGRWADRVQEADAALQQPCRRCAGGGARGLQASPGSIRPIGADVARWNSLQQSDNLPFSSYASFLLAIAAGRRDRDASQRPSAATRLARRGDPLSSPAFPPLTPPATPVYAFALRPAAAPTRRGRGARRLDRRRASGH
jgi:soluble lytic murein transglycosylase